LITLPAPTQQSIAQGRKKNREKIGKKVYCPLDKERAISTSKLRHSRRKPAWPAMMMFKVHVSVKTEGAAAVACSAVKLS
jgi:hypothetical protein